MEAVGVPVDLTEEAATSHPVLNSVLSYKQPGPSLRPTELVSVRACHAGRHAPTFNTRSWRCFTFLWSSVFFRHLFPQYSTPVVLACAYHKQYFLPFSISGRIVMELPRLRGRAPRFSLRGPVSRNMFCVRDADQTVVTSSTGFLLLRVFRIFSTNNPEELSACCPR